MDWAQEKRFLQTLALESGRVIAPYFGDPKLTVDSKSDETPVTVADRNAELKLRELIQKQFPAHGIIGEEFGNDRADAEFVWVLDPIDGTKAFVTGCPLFGTLIALLHQGKPVLGAIHQPILKQLCIGDGTVTHLNDQPVHLRSVSKLAEATLLYTELGLIAQHQSIAGFEALEARCRIVRTWGDCYGYLLLAWGFADIMVDPVMKPWDFLPLVPIIRGAGGSITNWQGGDVLSSDSVVAAAPNLHGEVIKILNPT
jgi:myo-inositol-1(or 4)-monophosphatase